MPAEKATPICVLQILSEYSDGEHILQMKELQTKLKTIYGADPDRRTIYSAINLLNEFGYDISTYEENGKGYYLRESALEVSEVHMLTDAVYAFPFIPSKQSEMLIAKLQRFLSCHQRKQYQHLTVVKPSRKTQNKQVFWNVDVLDQAIKQKRKVQFEYLHYDLEKRLVPRREKKYTVNPHWLVHLNAHYYLVCVMAYQQEFSLYRIDRMQNIQITEYALDEQAPKQSANDAIRGAVYAFCGKPEEIELLCDCAILDDVIDQFGTEIRVEKCEDRLRVQLTIPPQGVKFWALQYLPYVEVTKPRWLREEIIACLTKNPYRGSCDEISV